jgi:hypothetical protein
MTKDIEFFINAMFDLNDGRTRIAKFQELSLWLSISHQINMLDEAAHPSSREKHHLFPPISPAAASN